MIENKVYTWAEMKEANVLTDVYVFMDEAGEYVGILELKTEASSGMLRNFLGLEDERKIITPVFWWQRYLGFYEMDVGVKLKLNYEKNSKGGIYLTTVEKLE